MVQGIQGFQARLRAIPEKVRAEVKAAIEKVATNVVREMQSANPLPGTIKIDWTWGDAPAGSVTVGKVKGKEYDKISVTIYATAVTEDYPGGFPAIARWFEYGTNERAWKTRGKSGKIKETGRVPAQPYFFPTYRANRSRIKAAMTRAVKKGFQKS